MGNQEWKKAHPDQVLEHKRKYRQSHGSAPTVGGAGRRPWTQEEDKRVLEHSIPDSQLSTQIDRSVAAIQIRRSRIRVGPGPCGPCAGPGVLECEHTKE